MTQTLPSIDLRPVYLSGAENQAATERRFALSPGDTGTRETLSIMRELALRGATDPIVRETAIRAIAESGVPAHDLEGESRALFDFVRDRIRFTRDPSTAELVQSPRETLRLRVGDCDDRATLLASLLASVGHDGLGFRVAAYQNRNDFEHVYLTERMGGSAVAMDPTYSENALGFEPRGALRVEDFPL